MASQTRGALLIRCRTLSLGFVLVIPSVHSTAVIVIRRFGFVSFGVMLFCFIRLSYFFTCVQSQMGLTQELQPYASLLWENMITHLIQFWQHELH